MYSEELVKVREFKAALEAVSNGAAEAIKRARGRTGFGGLIFNDTTERQFPESVDLLAAGWAVRALTDASEMCFDAAEFLIDAVDPSADAENKDAIGMSSLEFAESKISDLLDAIRRAKSIMAAIPAPPHTIPGSRPE